LLFALSSFFTSVVELLVADFTAGLEPEVETAVELSVLTAGLGAEMAELDELLTVGLAKGRAVALTEAAGVATGDALGEAVAVAETVAVARGEALTAGEAVAAGERVGLTDAVGATVGATEAVGAAEAVAATDAVGAAVAAVEALTPVCVLMPGRAPLAPIPMLTPTAGCTP